MKQRSPLFVVAFGSLICSLLLTLLSLCFQSMYQFSLLFYLLEFAITFTILFFVFYLIVRSFIHDRLKLIYRSLRKHKFQEAQDVKFTMRSDVITLTEQESETVLSEQTAEIEELKKVEAFRTEFIGNLAHELKTPTFAIQGYIENLIDGAKDDKALLDTFLQRASLATERLTTLLTDLDQLTKLETQEVKIDKRPFDLMKLIQEIIESFEIEAKKKNITIKFGKEYTKEKMVFADKPKIAQVIMNLIANSIFYGKENGETIIRLYLVDDLVTVEVSDNGIGIEPQNIPRLFERFYRVEKSRNRNEGGSGLGLAIVRHILAQHEKVISVRSTVGVGSTFTFSLDKFNGNANTIVTSRGVVVR